MPNSDCIFCQIIEGQLPSHKIWEDEKHLAFLSIFPNTEGFTVIVPKKHFHSDAFNQDDKVLTELILATKKVAQILTNYFEDVGRCGMFIEGFEIDHLHSKLFPMHGTGDIKKWKPIQSHQNNTYFKIYPGYLSSNGSDRAEDEQLAQLSEEIRKSYQG